ncbi:hypothetical protein Cme02nite_50540 [Catellatospora methionotrophica]|uniref:Aminoglycoside phosphotransferase domain-containing protein n=1 Tax=Catellatospora methionotrophica TaxID=121620 RepID=A0A8J3L990_9ACTN|nr:phosphotransferase [Catellatospora methionotrophica]GIG16722.1 hypothetical protein Cme02nite_50540 [Catellatospora methionotrophica]
MDRVTGLPGLPHLQRLLSAHGVTAAGWSEANQQGFSGARIYRNADRPGVPFVIKVTAADTDWIMRATGDRRCREAVLAEAGGIGGGPVTSPAIGAARDGDVCSILMHDIGDQLLPNAPLTAGQLDVVLRAVSGLHALTPPVTADVPWCSVRDRVTLFLPDERKLAGFRIADDILRGWELFFQYAPGDVGDLVRALFDDTGPLEAALGELPDSLLHGDLKLDNIGLRPDGGLSLIDWSMPLIAPAAVDLGWFLAMNSRVLPVPVPAALAAYTSCSTIERGLHERHESLTVLCGLLIRGWRKALDAAAGEPGELRWWCERAAAAATLL